MTHIKEFKHLQIQLEAIKSATNNFAQENCIGGGGFGKVYKGKLACYEGNRVVALKRLDRKFGQGNLEFWKEIMMLSQYKHKNIVSLLGYCDDHGEKILVYEYVPKRSLDRYLDSTELKWVERLKICIGAAKGLAYLHRAGGTQQRLLHRDIKSSNILLDELWNAKISDFGLSKFGPANQKYTFLVSNPVGTPGYWDPLYAETWVLTKESDVYSFGVVLFEVLCGRPSLDYSKKKLPPLIGLVRQSYEGKTLDKIIYDNIKEGLNPESLKVFTKIAYQCLKRDREDRPSMTVILKKLQTALQCQEQIIHEVPNLDLLPNSLWGLALDTVKVKIEDDGPGGFLIVTIHEGNDLQGKHPFVILRVGHDTKKTTTIENDHNPVWKETFKFPLEKPPTYATLYLVVCSRLSTYIFRSDKDSLGNFDISLADVVKEGQVNKIYNLPKGWLHVELQWEPSAFPLEMNSDKIFLVISVLLLIFVAYFGFNASYWNTKTLPNLIRENPFTFLWTFRPLTEAINLLLMACGLAVIILIFPDLVSSTKYSKHYGTKSTQDNQDRSTSVDKLRTLANPLQPLTTLKLK